MTARLILTAQKHATEFNPMMRALAKWRHSRTGLGAVLFLVVTFFSHSITIADASELPELGGASALITPAQENRLGKAWLRSLRNQVSTLEDPLAIQYVHDLLYKLAPYSQLTDRNLTTVIVDADALNAFAVPGGIIGVNAGLFLYAQTEQEFASVLAHEIAHLSQRHFARRLEENQNQTALSMAGILASLIIAVAAGSDAGVAALAGSQAYTLQNQLSYSRLNEQEADRIGMETLAASGMDVRSMPAMFGRMLRSSRFNREPPEYLRTHPLTESRVADTANRAAEYPTGDYAENIDYYLVRSRIRLNYASAPEEALTYFRSLKNSSNKYQQLSANYGFVLAAIDANRPQEGKSSLQNLLNHDQNRISIVLLHAEWLKATGQLDDAKLLLSKHLDRNPGNYALSRLLADIQITLKTYDSALSVLYKLLPEYENEPNLWYTIAETAGLANHIVELHQARAEFYYHTGNSARALQQLKQALTKVDSNYQQSQIIRNRIKEVKKEQQDFDF